MVRESFKIAIVHNDYGKFSGEEAVVEQHIALLKSHGHEVVEFRRSSEELKNIYGKIKGLFTGIYNPFSVRQFAQFIDRHKPDIIHIHNLHPLITPWILPVAKKRKIPIVMTLHNFRLFCPNGLFYQHDRICEECPNHSRLSCIRHNCLNSTLKSIGYALRDSTHSMFNLYLDNIDAFLCLSSFQKNKLVYYGLPESKCHVVPNFVKEGNRHEAIGSSVKALSPKSETRNNTDKGNLTTNHEPLPTNLQLSTFHSSQLTNNHQPSTKSYIAYAGRLSEEKGIDLIVEAARLLPHIQFKLVGSISTTYLNNSTTQQLNNRPSNIEFMGYLPQDKLLDFLQGARIQIMASRCYEGFPTTLLHGMSLGLPSIVPNHGAIPEIIEGCGLVFDPGSSESLARSIQKLWSDDSLYSEFSQNALKKCAETYSTEVVYKKLISIYFQLTTDN